ncbi:aldo/keto reductase [Zhengella mangrovi]|uniref:Aldo/keto reductase n=1 Tax=Zhengella mangrovi TaxID=1982044 RepID=A0A2G1QRS6_9HYPH|nr:aldo/keto reductase [Zhengella mangrovi]PHP68236.1 aldo/keto reductase [Zhengella mangrovi]
MKMNSLGRTGIAVSEICLGTMTWGEQNTEAEAHAQMDHAVEQGINFFDTAEMYPTNPLRAETAGRTEEIIGSWLKARGRRDDIVLATKIVGKGNRTVRDGEPANAKTLREAVEKSLKRLGTDHIDLYQIHWPNRGSYHFRQNWTFSPWQQDRAQALADLEETVATAGDMVKEGKLRALGVSNDSVWGVAKMLEIAERSGGARVASVQNEYNLMCRLFDTDWAELSHHEDVGLLAYSPLAAGILSGKYLDGAVPAGSRRSITENLGGRWQEHAVPAMEAYVRLARDSGLDPAQMALAWCLTRPFMTSVIIGATSMEQLKTNIGAKDVTLGADVLEAIAAIHRRYPMPF